MKIFSPASVGLFYLIRIPDLKIILDSPYLSPKIDIIPYFYFYKNNPFYVKYASVFIDFHRCSRYWYFHW